MSDSRGEMPTVPDERLSTGGFKLVAETTETLFSLPGTHVEGHTLLFGDVDLRGQIEGATDGELDVPWRIFFATRLSFVPPLAPGIGPAMVRPSVTSEARREFADDLEARGFRAVGRGRTQRARTDAGERLRLTKYAACYGVAWEGREHDIDIEAWLGIWIHAGEFRLAGGAYPTRGFDALCDSLGVARDGGPNADREELLSLIRAVG